MVEQVGLEPTTLSLGKTCAVQLRHNSMNWQDERESNPHKTLLESVARPLYHHPINWQSSSESNTLALLQRFWRPFPFPHGCYSIKVLIFRMPVQPTNQSVLRNLPENNRNFFPRT